MTSEGSECLDPTAVIECGSRIFQEPLEAKSRAPKNAARRQKRMMRRTMNRRRMRRDTLVNVLREGQLLPVPGPEWEQLFHDHDINPYVLRAKGLDEALTLHQFGRVLFHLARRRGYLSNRRAERMDKIDDLEIKALVLDEEEAEKRKEVERAAKNAERRAERGLAPEASAADSDDHAVLAAIAQLEKELLDTEARTLGEYLYKGLQRGVAARGQHATRKMYEDEFETLWLTQRVHHPRVLTDALRADVHRAIFFQRPLKAPVGTAGHCQFERDRPAAPRAHPLAQRFRAYQDLNHLTLREVGTGTQRPLTAEERQKVLALLDKTKEVTWASIAKVVGLNKERVVFNLEAMRDKGLMGFATEQRLAKLLADVPVVADCRAKPWPQLSPDEQRELLTDLFTIDRRDALLRRLRKHWGYDAPTAYELAKTEFERGRASLSLKAIHQILPHLEQGLNYHDSFKAAGYLRPDERPKRAGCDVIDTKDVPNARNPVVDKALHEVRRVVNAICRTYGTPARVRIELARDMKLTKLQKEAALKAKKENDKNNERAREALKAPVFGIGEPGRDDLIKYRLWLECNGECPYTGQSIGQSQLFNGEVDIEHIVPYSRSLDDSIKNKTLCYTQYNRHHKRNRSPWECATGDDYEAILQRADRMKCGNFKRNKFRAPKPGRDGKVPGVDEFAQRQLNDTRHACIRAKEMLGVLGANIEICAGESTAALRHAWGLNTVLGDSGEKNRADHRHHAVDAVVIACTSVSLFQRMSRLSARSEESLTDQVRQTMAAAVPWPGFRADVIAAVNRIVVSHQTTRKVRGGLHEETAYGKTLVDGAVAFVSRKPVASLTAGEIERVRDMGIRRLIHGRFQDAGVDMKDKREVEAALKRGILSDSDPLAIITRHGERRLVKRVRVVSRSGEGRMIGLPTESPVRWHPTGANLCAHIYENSTTGERTAEVVPLYFGAAKRGGPPPSSCPPGWVKVMTLYRNDLVEIADAEFDVYRVVKFSPMKPIYLVVRPCHLGTEDSDLRIVSPPALLRLVNVLERNALGR